MGVIFVLFAVWILDTGNKPDQVFKLGGSVLIIRTIGHCNTNDEFIYGNLRFWISSSRNMMWKMKWLILKGISFREYFAFVVLVIVLFINYLFWKQFFRRFHAAYVDAVSNPFHVPGKRILSKAFGERVTSIVKSFGITTVWWISYPSILVDVHIMIMKDPECIKLMSHHLFSEGMILITSWKSFFRLLNSLYPKDLYSSSFIT